MPRNLYQELLRYLHFVNNDSINAQDKLAKICPLISMVRDEFVKIEPEEYKWVDEQIIPVKAKYSSIRQYNPKKPKRWGFKNLVHADIAGFMYDFSVYDGKNSAELDDGKFGHLQKRAQVVTKLCSDLPGHKNYKKFFDNWFTTFGTIWLNRLRGCPPDSTKVPVKNGGGAMDRVVMAILE